MSQFAGPNNMNRRIELAMLRNMFYHFPRADIVFSISRQEQLLKDYDSALEDIVCNLFFGKFGMPLIYQIPNSQIRHREYKRYDFIFMRPNHSHNFLNYWTLNFYSFMGCSLSKDGFWYCFTPELAYKKADVLSIQVRELKEFFLLLSNLIPGIAFSFYQTTEKLEDVVKTNIMLQLLHFDKFSFFGGKEFVLRSDFSNVQKTTTF